MATDTTQSQVESVENDRYIDKKIQATARQVKLVSLATSITTLLVGVVAYLLLLSLVDHWVWGFSVWGRLVALVILLLGSAAFFILRVLPGLIRSVNPVFAAQTIEGSSPTLKNSLINFLLLRDHQAGTRQVILEGVKRQAVGNLHQVPGNAIVDRSELIRIGYVLAALVILFGAYRVLSPKDPFQTVARVAAPWKAIDRPSRAKIEEVVPGNVDIYRGQSVDIEAVVTGLRDDEAVELLFSTTDGRIVDRTMKMMRSESGRRFQSELTTGSSGIQDDLIYSIRAGDAQTELYRVTVKDAPSIDIKRLTLTYPSYTKRPEEQFEQQGDIAALEGTRVRIEALANQPIRGASIELFDGESAEPVKSLPMRHTGDVAHGFLDLKFNPDGKTPTYVGYQLRFTNDAGHRNPEPVRYQIDVIRDLPPLVEILNPRRREIELPVNQRLMIEVRALDPDFALNDVRLHGAAGGLELLKHSFLTKPHEGQGIFVYQFRPDEIGLTPGDTLVYWAEAEDNRRISSEQASPNMTRSGNYRIRVTDAKVAEEQEADEDAAENAPQEDGDGGDQEGEEGEEGSGGAGGDQTGSGQGQSESDSSEEGASGEAGDNGAGNQASENTGKENGEPSGDSQNGDSQNGENSTSDSELSESSEGDGGQGGGDESQQDSEQTGSDSQGSEGDQQSQAGGSGDEQGDPRDREPVASDGSNDGDAIDRILEHQRENQERSNGNADSDNEAEQSESSNDEPNESVGEDTQSTDSFSQEASDGEQTGSASTDEGSDQTLKPEEGSSESQPTETDDQSGNSEAGRSEDAATDSDNEQQTEQSGRGADDSTSDQQNVEDSNQADPDSSNSGNAKDLETDRQPTERQPSSGDTEGSNPREQQQPSDDAQSDSSDSGASQNSGSSDGEPQDGEPQDGEPQDGEPQDGESGSQTAGGDEAPETQSQADSESNTSNGSGSNTPGQSDSTAASESDSDSPAKTGGSPTESSGSPGESGTGEPGEEEANLEYAREATDLALEHLRDQQDNRELLDRLGWTPEEARQFLQRWQEMKQSAQQPDARGKQAQREMDDRLQGLGLRPQQGRTRSIKGDDRFTGLREGAARSAPPAQYREHYRAFLRGLGQNPEANSESE